MKKFLIVGFIALLNGPICLIGHDILSAETIAPLEPQEYVRNGVSLAQIPVLNQFRESGEKGSTNASCPYHALRNGIIVAQAMINQNGAFTHLAKLYDKDDMAEKLSLVDSSWRNKVWETRPTGNSDNVDTQEMDTLTELERTQGILKDTDVSIATFENARGKDPLTEAADFKAFCAHDRQLSGAPDDIDPTTNAQYAEHISGIKYKLDNNIDVTGIILVYLQEKIDATGSLEDITAAYSEEGGHWVSLVVNQVNNRRQYILMDSAGSHSLFEKNATIQGLITYLEGSENPITPVSRLNIPVTDTNPLWKVYATHKLSYGVTSQSKDKRNARFQGPKVQETSQAQTFIYGLLTGIAFYIVYNYYQNHYVLKKAQSSPAQPAVR